MRTIPDAQLKKLHRRKGGGYFGLCIKIYRALGTLYAKQTFNRIAANDCYEPILQYSAPPRMTAAQFTRPIVPPYVLQQAQTYC